ncbi:hypothetical protein [Streptomyces lonarensis]|uniref:Uncharacterized protein n=1 Tax=Streptomyces lonarensis TaxID=700599 RepID=A0A7X6D2G4_9ACTN|nr:hypothetical protein [Streptomyces lonarensis]NJQ06977.1 hypothetical protein [Streptomyces lonarensis]
MTTGCLVIVSPVEDHEEASMSDHAPEETAASDAVGDSEPEPPELAELLRRAAALTKRIDAHLRALEAR